MGALNPQTGLPWRTSETEAQTGTLEISKEVGKTQHKRVSGAQAQAMGLKGGQQTNLHYPGPGSCGSPTSWKRCGEKTPTRTEPGRAPLPVTPGQTLLR